MPSGPEKPNEYHRYRQILAAIYVVTIASGVVLLSASVVDALCFRPAVVLQGPTLDAVDPDPADLLKCNRDVDALLGELSRMALALVSRATAGDDPPAISSDWEQFSQGWLQTWEEVNAWCRFSELSGGHMGNAYDRMARVHADLPAMRLKYQSLLVRFEQEQAGELASMRRALERSRRELEASTRTKEGQAK